MKLTAFFAFCLTLALSIFWIGHWNPPLQQHEIVTKASGLTDSPQTSKPTFAAEEKPLEPGLAEALSKARHHVRELTAEEVKLPKNQQVRAFAANPGQQLTARFSRVVAEIP